MGSGYSVHCHNDTKNKKKKQTKTKTEVIRNCTIKSSRPVAVTVYYKLHPLLTALLSDPCWAACFELYLFCSSTGKWQESGPSRGGGEKEYVHQPL